MSQKAWMNAYTKGSKSLQARLAKIHANNPEFQEFVKKHGFGGNLSVKQSGIHKQSVATVKPVAHASPEKNQNLDREAAIKAAAEKLRNRRLANANRVAFGGELGGGFQMPMGGFRTYRESALDEVLRHKPGAIAALRRQGGNETRRLSAAKQKVMDKDPEGFAAHQQRVKAAKALLRKVTDLHNNLSSPYAYERGKKREPIDTRTHNLLLKHVNALREALDYKGLKRLSKKPTKAERDYMKDDPENQASFERIRKRFAKRANLAYLGGKKVNETVAANFRKVIPGLGKVQAKNRAIDLDNELEQGIKDRKFTRKERLRRAKHIERFARVASGGNAFRKEEKELDKPVKFDKPKPTVVMSKGELGKTREVGRLQAKLLAKQGWKVVKNVKEAVANADNKGKKHFSVHSGPADMLAHKEYMTKHHFKEPTKDNLLYKKGLIKQHLQSLRRGTSKQYDYPMNDRGEIAEAVGEYVKIHSPEHKHHGKEARVFHKFDDGRINVQLRTSTKKGKGVYNYTLKPGEYKNISEDIAYKDGTIAMYRGGWIAKRDGKRLGTVMPTDQHAKSLLDATHKSLAHKTAAVISRKAKEIARGLGRFSLATESAANRRRVRSWDSAIMPELKPLTVKPKQKLPFDPDPPKSNPGVVVGRNNPNYSRARHLARAGLKKAMERDRINKTVDYISNPKYSVLDKNKINSLLKGK